MWTYSTNMMGPMNHWYEENKIQYKIIKRKSTLFGKEIEFKKYNPIYYGGRIDCRCSNPKDKDYDIYGVELGLEIMEAESYSKFSDWLSNFKSKKLKTEKELYSLYEEKNGKIKFFNKTF